MNVQEVMEIAKNLQELLKETLEVNKSYDTKESKAAMEVLNGQVNGCLLAIKSAMPIYATIKSYLTNKGIALSSLCT